MDPTTLFIDIVILVILFVCLFLPRREEKQKSDARDWFIENHKQLARIPEKRVAKIIPFGSKQRGNHDDLNKAPR